MSLCLMHDDRFEAIIFEEYQIYIFIYYCRLLYMHTLSLPGPLSTPSSSDSFIIFSNDLLQLLKFVGKNSNTITQPLIIRL